MLITCTNPTLLIPGLAQFVDGQAEVPDERVHELAPYTIHGVLLPDDTLAPAAAASGAPKRNAPRQAWVDYAASEGVEIPEGATIKVIRAAIEAVAADDESQGDAVDDTDQADDARDGADQADDARDGADGASSDW